MHRPTILIVGTPAILRDILRHALGPDPQPEFVMSLGGAIRRSPDGIDALIAAVRPANARAAARIIRLRFPRARFVLLDPDGRVMGYGRPRHPYRPVADAGLSDLVAFVREEGNPTRSPGD